MARTEEFNLKVVLSVVHKRGFGEEKEVIKLLKFMTGKTEVKETELCAVMNLCRPILVQQFPDLDSVQIRNDLAKMDSLIDQNNNPTSDKNIFETWLSEIITSTNYGETLEVKSVLEMERIISRQKNLSRLIEIKKQFGWTT